jgi:hypothetical protein
VSLSPPAQLSCQATEFPKPQNGGGFYCWDVNPLPETQAPVPLFSLRRALPQQTSGVPYTFAGFECVEFAAKGRHHEFPILPLADCFGPSHYSVRRMGTTERAASIRSKAGADSAAFDVDGTV